MVFPIKTLFQNAPPSPSYYSFHKASTLVKQILLLENMKRSFNLNMHIQVCDDFKTLFSNATARSEPKQLLLIRD